MKTMRIASAAFRRNITSQSEFYKWASMYQQNMIFIAGYPKSGSSWFAQLLAELPGFSIYHPRRWAVIDDVNMDKNNRMPVYME